MANVQAKFEVHGAREMEQAFRQLPKEIVGKKGGPLKSALMSGALPVMKDMKKRVRKDTRRLEKGIKRRRNTNPKLTEEVDIGVFYTKGAPFWARFEEFGTVHREAHPFMRPAIDSQSETAVQTFRKKAALALVRIGKKIGDKNAVAVGTKFK